MSNAAAGEDVLERIAEVTRRRLAETPPAPGLVEQAQEHAARRAERGGRSLLRALSVDGVRVIAECKRRSPSKGWLREPFEPMVLARAYEAGGAAAISVVTEPEFFAGETGWLAAVRGQVDLPVLQKDFLLCERQLHEAVLAGADAVLLIARLLPRQRLAEMLAASEELGLDALVEVHDRAEAEAIAGLPVRLAGVNSRDLRTFQVDLDGASEVARSLPEDCVVVMESGISGPADVSRMRGQGVCCFLVGEHLLRAGDPEAALRELVACG